MQLSIFTDELGLDITEAVPINKSWGLDTVDLRGRVYGKSFESLDAQQLQDLKKLLDDHNMQVGCLQSSLAKSHQPDAEVHKAEAKKLEGIIRAADMLDCRRVRSFPERSVSNEEMSKRTVMAMQKAWPAAARGGIVARKSGRGLQRPWHDDPVGFAIVGLGMGFNRAREITETSGTRLVGVCDLIPERAQKVGGTFDVPHSTDMKRWLESDDVDVIIVMTETGNHGKVAMEALNAGKHVLTTKPMDANVENCNAMIQLADDKGLMLGVDFDMRHSVGFCALQAAIKEGCFGKLRAGNLQLKVQRTEDYFKHNNAWRGTQKLDGGGVLSNQSIHYVDQIAFTVGVPSKVRCHIWNQNHPYIEAEDLGTAVWLYDNGTVITYSATTSYPHATWYWQYELHGEEGAFWDAGGGPFDTQTTRWFYDDAWRNNPPVDVEPEWFNSMDNFAAVIRDGAQLTVPGCDGRVSRTILDAMYKSAHEMDGGWVDV